jgi:glycine hydroxymethyltransferase
MKPEFSKYAATIVGNAKTLAEELLARSWRLVSGGTDNHMLMIDLRSRKPDLTGHQASERLAAAGIITNKNSIPFDPRKPVHTSGIRMGTPALTTRGMGPAEMKTIAEWIDMVLNSDGDQGVIDRVHDQVLEMCRQFPIANNPT